MTAEPMDKPNGGRARSYHSQPILKPNIFNKVNAKLPRATKLVVEIPVKKHIAPIDLTEDTDDDFAAEEAEIASKNIGGTTVGEISKDYLDLQRAVVASLESHRSEEDGLDFQRAVEESLFVERDCNGLTRAEKEKLRMSDGLDGGSSRGSLKEVREVNDEVLAGFEGGREWSDQEMDEIERGIMYDEEEGGIIHEDEEGGETVLEGEEESSRATLEGEGERP